uniref:SnoaL-like domain-containing protein n=1 Tax=Leersia perrieri TaxID=77586 RepID=A0A0D9XBS4_9ORYZ
MALIHPHLAPRVAPAAGLRLSATRTRWNGRGGGSRTASSTVEPAARGEESPAAEVVRGFYDGVNRRDLAAVEPLIAEGCVYEDLVFPQPYVGRDQILKLFGGFTGSISPDLRFVIDDISADDSSAVGVTWHLEWKGRAFPFSRGCSFYRLELEEGKREKQQLQIVYGRDCVEPAIKPGETALIIIRAVTWILERFPRLATML